MRRRPGVPPQLPRPSQPVLRLLAPDGSRTGTLNVATGTLPSAAADAALYRVKRLGKNRVAAAG